MGVFTSHPIPMSLPAADWCDLLSSSLYLQWSIPVYPGLQRREGGAMEEYPCYQLASKKCKGYSLDLALPRQIFPFENPSSTYLPSSNNFLVCKSFPKYYLPLDFSIANGQLLVYLKKFCFPTKSFCILVKKRSYFFIVFPTFLNVILQKISIMSAQGNEDVTFFQVKSLNCLQLLFLFYGEKKKKSLFLSVPLS